MGNLREHWGRLEKSPPPPLKNPINQLMVTLPETNIAPENGWKMYFLLGPGLFSGAMLVSGSVIVGLGPGGLDFLGNNS